MSFMRLILLAIIFVSACVTTPPTTEKGLLLKMDANPREVFGDAITTISVDVENQDVKTLRGVNVDIFEIGSFDFVDKRKCAKNFSDMEPKDFKTFACNLKAKKVERNTDNTVWARARYKSSLGAVQTFDIISQSEAELRKKTGRTDGQKAFSFKDNNLELTMELSNSPIVDKAGKEFVSFKIKNIGNGLIEKLDANKIRITSSKQGLIDANCPSTDISIIGREFPRFSCALNLNGGVGSFLPVQIKIEINYPYEIRNNIDVIILKGVVETPERITPTVSPIPVIPSLQPLQANGQRLARPAQPIAALLVASAQRQYIMVVSE